jgi:hypothetical protein
MTIQLEIKAIVDAIDWDAPTGRPVDPIDLSNAAERDPALFDFVFQASECIPDPQDWERFKKALRRYQVSGRRR